MVLHKVTHSNTQYLLKNVTHAQTIKNVETERLYIVRFAQKFTDGRTDDGRRAIALTHWNEVIKLNTKL